MKNEISKLTLGTAQLGFSYGINNSQGQPTEKETREILNYAFANGINAIDTSPNYGNSEKRIGQFVRVIRGLFTSEPFIITKLDAQDFPEEVWGNRPNLFQKVEDELNYSRQNLDIEMIPAYILHFANQAFWKEGVLLDRLVKMKKKGYVKFIGTSLYTGEELERCIDDKRIDVVQLPFSILDRRLLESGLLRKASERGIIIFARSVFLQGLVFMQQLPVELSNAQRAISGLYQVAAIYDMSVNELCLRYVLSINEISSVVIGIDSLNQLKENIRVASLGPLDKDILKRIEKMLQMPAELIDIRSWGQKFDFTGGTK